jgi:hypothetical protein
MSQVDKALHILNSGLPVQKNAVLERLDSFIQQDRELRVFTAVAVTPRQRMLPLSQESLQVTAGKSFQRLVESQADLNEALIQLAMQILSVWSAPVHEVWLPVFSKLAGRVRKELLSTTIGREVLKLSDFNQAKTYRMAACSMTPALAPKVPEKLSQQLVKKAFDLSQDIEFSIRLRMAKELDQLFEIGHAFVQNQLWPKILALLEDDNSAVQKEALNLLLKSLKFLTQSFRKEQGLPHVLRALSGPFATEVILPRSGEFLQLCRSELESLHQTEVFMEFYRSQLLSPDSTTAVEATRNLPGILLVLGAARNDYDSLLLGSVRSRHPNAKKLVAKALPDIISSFSARRDLMRTVILELLEDPAVQLTLLPNLPSLQVRADIDCSEIYSQLLSLLQHSNWRVQTHSLAALQSMLRNIPQPSLRDTLPELLYAVMHTGATPARNKAAEVTAQLTSVLCSTEFRREVIAHMAEQLGHSKSHQDRQVYLEYCLHAMTYFSRGLFKTYFLDMLLTLSRDRETSVRTKFATLIPAFRKGLTGDASLALSDVVNQLMEDPHRTVAEAAGNAHAAMMQADFWKNLDSEEVRRVNRLKEEAEAQMLVEEQRSLDETKKRFVEQLAARAKQEYKDKKLKPKLNPRASMKIPSSPPTKPLQMKRSSMIDIRGVVSRAVKK